MTRLDPEQIYRESKEVFTRYQTSEYAFLVEELPSLREMYPGADLSGLFRPAIDAYRDARRASLKLYPAVLDTLTSIKRSGSLIVGHTESMRFYSVRRVKNLGLDGLLDVLYVQDEHDLPDWVDLAQIRKYEPEAYLLQQTDLRNTPRGETKPAAHILRSMMCELHCDANLTAYVGDNKAKDMAMAQAAGTVDVHAAYGEAHKREQYELLKKVTHWPSEQVQREAQAALEPSYVLKDSFSELLDLFEFTEYKSKP